MKLETSIMLKRLLKRWPLVGLLIISMAAAGACVGAEFGSETDFILAEVEQSGTLLAPTEFEGEVIVYAADAQYLLTRINAADTIDDKEDAIKDYLKRQERIDCILDKIEDAVEDNSHINCEGKKLVDKKDAETFLEDIEAGGTDAAGRAFLTDFLLDWEEEQRVERVMEGLSQIKRTGAIPIFGKLITSIHHFPIAYEGDVLVPKEDLDDLLDEFKALDTKEAREKMVDDYLLQREGLSP